jgi:hypothetical protein
MDLVRHSNSSRSTPSAARVVAAINRHRRAHAGDQHDRVRRSGIVLVIFVGICRLLSMLAFLLSVAILGIAAVIFHPNHVRRRPAKPPPGLTGCSTG